jgi:hypothetical protein
LVGWLVGWLDISNWHRFLLLRPSRKYFMKQYFLNSWATISFQLRTPLHWVTWLEYLCLTLMREINNMWRYKHIRVLNVCYDDHVDWVRLCLWTSAVSRRIVHPAGNKWAWKNMVELYRQGKSWLVQQSSLTIIPTELSSSRVGGTGMKWWIWPCEVSLFILLRGYLT